MLISKYIRELMPDELCSVQNEREVVGLGLNNYGPECPYCCFVAKEKFLETLSAYVVEVITIPELEEVVLNRGLGCICVKDPKNIFFMLHNYLSVQSEYVDNDAVTSIGENCIIDEKAVISPQGVKIGNNVIIEENVIIRENVEIGDNTIIRAGTIIGAQDLEVKEKNGETYRVKHVGKVYLGRNVEVGYNNVIGRAIYPWDVTKVDDYTQTSQNVVVGHGVKLDKRILISSGTTICGRTHVGDDAWIGPNVVISNGLNIGAKSYLSIGTCVIKDVADGVKVFGNPARTMPL